MQLNNGRKVKAPYQTIGPRKESVTFQKCSYQPVDPKDPKGARKLVVENVSEVMDTYLVRFAMGHSTRFCGPAGLAEMQRMGYDKKPRLIDLETGDVVDIGGDPYDLTDATEDDAVVLTNE